MNINTDRNITTRKPRRDEYRGNPLLVLPLTDHSDFSFGVGKARCILAHIEAIREFVADFEPNRAPRLTDPTVKTASRSFMPVLAVMMNKVQCEDDTGRFVSDPVGYIAEKTGVPIDEDVKDPK